MRTELLLNDGHGRIEDNSARWIHRGPLPHVIEFTWDQPVRLGAARIISGYYSGGVVEAPLRDFVLQWHDGAAWRDIAGTPIRANTQAAWAGTFGAIATTRLRLCITATKDATSRIWEVELFGPPAQTVR